MKCRLTDKEIKQNIHEHKNGFLYQHRFFPMELTITEIPDNMQGYGWHHASHNGLKITLTPADSDESLSILLTKEERLRLKEKL